MISKKKDDIFFTCFSTHESKPLLQITLLLYYYYFTHTHTHTLRLVPKIEIDDELT